MPNGEFMAMASIDFGNCKTGGGSSGGVHVVQVNDSEVNDEISPLLVEVGEEPPRMTIFSVSYTRKRPPKETSLTMAEAEANFLSQILMWVWSGSKYSGLLCMASSSAIYYIMEVLMDIFPVQTVPLFESVFTRCTIIVISSLLWLRKVGHPLVPPKHARNLLILRSLSGFISLLSFIYSVKNLPLSYAICLNFTSPIVASIGAKIILQEKLTISDIGGLSLSYLGVLFVFQPTLLTQGNITEAGDMSNSISATRAQSVFAVFLGLFSSFLNGICYCIIRAAAKASDHPVYSVFSFGLFASPMSAICTLTMQKFVLPNIFTFFFMVILGVLAFLAEISVARGLQLEKICKATNVIYIQVILSLFWNMSYLGTSVSFNKLLGGLLILVSVCSTFYVGPEKEPNDAT